MKIKKVDDKPMVIHTKEKAKIHAHEPKGAKITYRKRHLKRWGFITLIHGQQTLVK